MGYNLGIPFWTCVWAAVFPDVHTLRKWNQINGNKEQDEKEESAWLGDENNVYLIIFGL